MGSEPLHDGSAGPGTEVASVYVHAPFCARRCQYCDFAVQVQKDADPGVWLHALARERALLDEEGVFRLADRLDTLYVGGGTPSLFGTGAMAGLARVVGRERLEASSLEWTSEANPESFTSEVAEDWREAGVNRVSLGIQSFHEPALRWMGRLHGSSGAYRAVEAARDAGFREVSVDLIFGLPKRTERSWSEDLRRVIDLGVPHVSLYGLTVEAGTPLGRSVSAGRVDLPPEERYREEYLEAVERLTGAGWIHYEVSNFAQPGHESRHNQVYWTGGGYLGLGNGAHGYAHPLRRWNLRDWNAYENALHEGRLPVEGQETLDPEAYRLERTWLQLRTRHGVPCTALSRGGRELARSWVDRGLASVSESVRLTAAGWLVMDRLTLELDARLEGSQETRPRRSTFPPAKIAARKGRA